VPPASRRVGNRACRAATRLVAEGAVTQREPGHVADAVIVARLRHGVAGEKTTFRFSCCTPRDPVSPEYRGDLVSLAQGLGLRGLAPTTWRVKRIRWGRPQAKIWIGKPDGPSFTATGAVVSEPDVHPVLFETFARKYASGWKSYEKSFREGLADGSRVLIRYTPN
jgi:hypothetical protein